MINRFMDELRVYAAEKPQVESVIIVGSYARGTNREGSDIDVVIITSDKAGMVADPGFAGKFGEIVKEQTEYYGACTSIRVWYRDGKEVEFGIVEPSWMELPLDPGTRRVLSDGFLVITDKKRYFEERESLGLPL